MPGVFPKECCAASGLGRVLLTLARASWAVNGLGALVLTAAGACCLARGLNTIFLAASSWAGTTLDFLVKFENRPHQLKELCGLLSAKTRPRLELKAHPPLESAEARPGAGEMPIWDVIESVYMEKALRPEEEEEGVGTLVLKPSDAPRE